MEFSLSNTFLPLSELTTKEKTRDATGDQSTRLAQKLLFDYGAGVGFIVRGLFIIQSLRAITLAFLFGLAVRRKFQIG